LEFDQFPTDRPLEFLKMGHHDFIKSDFVKFKGIPRSIFYTDDTSDKTKSLIDKKYESPTKLIKFIPDTTLDYISPILDSLFTISSPIAANIEIPSIIQTYRGFFESVSDLNGIAIPALYYDKLQKNNGKNMLYKMIENSLIEMKENEHMYLKRIVDELPDTCGNINEYLLLANIYTAIQERLYFKLKQINRDEYTWITETIMKSCILRLDDVIGSEVTIENPSILSEHTIIHHSMEEQHAKIDQTLGPHFPENMRFRFTAIVDLITNISVWELKCTSDISMDHKLQVVIYAWLWDMLDKPKKDFKILNIKTGEIVIMNYKPDEITKIIIALLKGKYDDVVIRTDEEFLRDCRSHLTRTITK